MPNANPTLNNEIKSCLDGIKKNVDDKTNALKEIAEKAMSEVKSHGELTTKTREIADEALKTTNELRESIKSLEQTVAEASSCSPQGIEKSLGDQVTEDEAVKSFIETKSRGSVSFVYKAALVSSALTGIGAAGALVQPHRVPGVLAPPQIRLTIRDLLAPGNTTSNLIEYVKESGFTNSAKPVAEGTEKPQSDITYKQETVPVQVIAHYVKATRQIMSDASQLASLINSRLLYGLKLVEENQLLNGDGTSPNLHGLLPQATAFLNSTAITTPTMIDMLRLAMLQAELAEYPASGHILNPINWTIIELEKDEVGRYLISSPQDGTTPRMWGLPVVATKAMAQDSFLTGAFSLAAQIFDREEARIEIAYQHDKDFTSNLVTILNEERLALAVYRPEALIKGTFT